MSTRLALGLVEACQHKLTHLVPGLGAGEAEQPGQDVAPGVARLTALAERLLLFEALGERGEAADVSEQDRGLEGLTHRLRVRARIRCDPTLDEVRDEACE